MGNEWELRPEILVPPHRWMGWVLGAVVLASLSVWAAWQAVVHWRGEEGPFLALAAVSAGAASFRWPLGGYLLAVFSTAAFVVLAAVGFWGEKLICLLFMLFGGHVAMPSVGVGSLCLRWLLLCLGGAALGQATGALCRMAREKAKAARRVR